MRTLADQQLQTLCHLKMSEQLSWNALSNEYEKLYDDVIDWRTLRSILLRDAPASYWAGPLEDEVVAALDAFLDKAQLSQMAAYVMLETFREWKMLQGVYMRWRVERHSLSKAERTALGEDAIQFDGLDLARLDQLKEEVKDFFLEAMKQQTGAENSGVQIINILENRSPQTELIPGGSQLSLAEALEERISAQAGIIQEDLRAIHAEHREEARGIYRPLNESLNDNDEDDIAI